MNKYIALAVVLPFLLFFILQYTLEIKNTDLINKAETIVTAACEQAKQEGYFTNDIIDQMKEDFTNAGIDPNTVSFTVTTTPKYRTDEFDSRELLEYKIGVPIDNIFAARSLFGLSEEENSTIKYYSGKLASERLNR